MGLGSGGVGLGGLVFAITTRAALAAYGIRITYIINGGIVFALLTPATILFKRGCSRILDYPFLTCHM